MPGLESKGAPAFEGNYSSYSQKWLSNALSGSLGVNGISYSGIDVNAKRVFLMGYSSNLVILNLDTGAIIEEFAAFGYMTGRIGLSPSILCKYIAIQLDASHIRIYKDGSLIQTLTITEAGVDIRGISISYNGQYIIAYDFGNEKIYCFQGS